MFKRIILLMSLGLIVGQLYSQAEQHPMRAAVVQAPQHDHRFCGNPAHISNNPMMQGARTSQEGYYFSDDYGNQYPIEKIRKAQGGNQKSAPIVAGMFELEFEDVTSGLTTGFNDPVTGSHRRTYIKQVFEDISDLIQGGGVGSGCPGNVAIQIQSVYEAPINGEVTLGTGWAYYDNNFVVV